MHCIHKQKFMKYDPNIHHRNSTRLQNYDYAKNGMYFVTICAQNRECLFGKTTDGEMKLNDAGKMIDIQWNELPNRFGNIELDEYAIMPNHFHGIIEIDNNKKTDIVGAPLVGAHVTANGAIAEIRAGTANRAGIAIRAGTVFRAGTRPAPTGDKKIKKHVGAPLVVAQNTMVAKNTVDISNTIGANKIGNIIGAFKSITTHEYIMGVKNNNWLPFIGKLWQRNFYDRIIRDENELNRIREYIFNNPSNWEKDENNAENIYM